MCVGIQTQIVPIINQASGIKKQTNKQNGGNVSFPSSTKRIKNIQELLSGLRRGFPSFYISWRNTLPEFSVYAGCNLSRATCQTLHYVAC